MDDFGSAGNRKLLLLLLVASSSLLRHVHLAETSSEDSEGRRVGRIVSLADGESGEGQLRAPRASEKEDKTTPRPDPCRSPISAMSIIREEYNIFSGKWFWRVNRAQRLVGGDPLEIHLMWYGLPHNLSQVDAVCERTTNGKIIFFIGPSYWELDDNRGGKFPKSGRPLTELGFARDVRRVDAAFVSPKDDRTYVVAGDRLWRMNASGNGVERDVDGRFTSPLSAASSSSSSSSSSSAAAAAAAAAAATIDAAFTNFEGKIYVVGGDYFWEVSDPRNASASNVRLRNESTLFGCNRELSAAAATTTTIFSLNAALFVSLVAFAVGLLETAQTHLLLLGAILR